MDKIDAKFRLEIWLRCLNCEEPCHDGNNKTLCNLYDLKEALPLEEAIQMGINALDVLNKVDRQFKKTFVPFKED